MPAVQPPAKVLVSGATGYVAAWIVQNLLEKGYHVRGTARSVTKGSFLRKLFASYSDRFEIVIVEDMAQDGAFDKVVKGIDAIEHTASPFRFDIVDPDEFVKPAINGTVGILKSILRDGSSKVRRVVVTSSTSTISRTESELITFTEADWNDQCLETFKKYEEEGTKNEMHSMIKYEASKTLAERAPWEFVNDPENKSRIHWDLVVINPPFICGPPIHEVITPASLNTSALGFHNLVANADKADAAGNEFLANTGTAWSDVRDVAEAHVLALEKEAAGGERIIISNGLWKIQDFIDAANDLSPPPKLSTTLPVGVRGAGKTAKHLVMYDTSKADHILGLKYRTMEEMTRDTFADYEARGW